MAAEIPSKTKVLVIGGGPAGSYCSCVLGREGIETVLLEGAQFPRYHIGESLLPSVRHFMRFIDLDERMNSFGFYPKIGGAFKLSKDKQEGYTDFTFQGPENTSWNAYRQDFDNILFQYAKECGTKAFDNTAVTSINWEGTPGQSKPVSVEYKTSTGVKGKIDVEYVVDASGRNGIISTKYLQNRNFNQTLKNIASWGYWTGTGKYGVGTKREGAPMFEALTDQSGWVWFIPLHNGTTSVGVVVHEDQLKEQRKALEERTGDTSLRAHYLDELKLAPEITKLIGDGKLVEQATEDETIKRASDFSYWADSYAGPNYRLAGDAGAFLDPFFSSGVHLANTGGFSAAATICASIRGHCDEKTASEWHHARIQTSFTRFLVVVLAIYRQMHKQRNPILSDIDEEGFHRAFDLFRPIIQGRGEASNTQKLTDEDLTKTMNFALTAMEHTEPEEILDVKSRIPDKFISPMAKPISKEEIDAAIDKDDEVGRRLAGAVQGRKLFINERNLASFSGEAINGYVVIFKRGELGLVSEAENTQDRHQTFW